uniref:Uncharacterized protein n=1 Tax=Picea glauca TaxID=3330 RepID=A0A124GN71_PICGL|nr:hypothetical protein ABT39_MTgene4847 [Picea glauca]QHR88663.1 hypothetical protein Q903MT_gene2677 [Picea sitchensis]
MSYPYLLQSEPQWLEAIHWDMMMAPLLYRISWIKRSAAILLEMKNKKGPYIIIGRSTKAT